MLLSTACTSVGEIKESNKLQLICMADIHSAYRSLPGIVGYLEEYSSRTEDPIVILINGDLFEKGNTVSDKTGGAIEWKFLEKLQNTAPVVFNIGNHEGAFEDDLRLVVDRMESLGIVVLSNIADRNTGQALAPNSQILQFGNKKVRFIGMATDQENTYRSSHREKWAFPNPEKFIETALDTLIGEGDLHVVLNHSGIQYDQLLVEKLPRGSVILGGHDHLTATYESDGIIALHTGWWGSRMDIVSVHWENKKAKLERTTVNTNCGLPEDGELKDFIEEKESLFLNESHRKIRGVNKFVSGHEETKAFVLNNLHRAIGTDATLINNTTFGAPLPEGNVREYDLANTIRFDGYMKKATVVGSDLIKIMKLANQSYMPDWNLRTGEYALGLFPTMIYEDSIYSISVNPWMALPENQKQFLGIDSSLHFVPVKQAGTIRGITAAQIH